MAMGDAINSDMAKVLLRKIKSQDTAAPDKKENKEESFKGIIDKLNDLREDIDKDSKEAKETRKMLIEELLEQFEKKGLSIKEQKEVLTRVDESLQENFNLLKSFNIANINKFFTTISNPKLLGDAINKGLSASNIGKAVDMLPKMFTKINNAFSSISAFANKAIAFFKSPADFLKSFASSIVSKASEFIQQQFKNFTTTLWKVAIRPILVGIGRLGAQIFAIGMDISVMLVRMAFGFVSWMVTTIVPLLFSILGFLTFTVLPMLFSIVTSIVGFLIFTVVPMLFTIIGSLAAGIASILAAITPILLVTAAVLLIGIGLGYLLWKAYEAIKKFVTFIFSDEFTDAVMYAVNVVVDWFWDNVMMPVWNTIKDLVQSAWDGIVYTVTAVKDFFVDTVWGEWISPAIQSVVDTVMYAWDTLAAPVFEWIKDFFIESWNLALEGFAYVKETIDKIFAYVGKIGEGLGEVASTVTGGIASAWEWTTSFFATGGIVTKPTNAVIGEAGVNEAVIPLDKKGMQFIRESFQIDDVTVQQIVKSSDLYKNQNKMMDILVGLDKDIKQIKFSIAEIKKENEIEKPREILVAVIKPEQLDKIDQEPKKIFDINEIEKLVSDSNLPVLEKLVQIMEVIKNMPQQGSELLLNPGNQVVDEYQNLVRAISTGIIGVR